MSISSLGLYSPNLAGDAPFPPAAQQAKDALAQTSYQSRISDYGQIQNALSSLQSSIQQSAAPDAASRTPAAYANQENRLFQAGSDTGAASSAISQITQSVQSFVNAYNSAQNASSQSPLAFAVNSAPSAALSSIGITANQNGTLSLNTQALQGALSSQPGQVAQAFAGIALSASQQVSAVQSQVQSGQNPPSPQVQASGNSGQVSFASQSSNVPQSPQPAQKVESTPGTGPNLAAQYSIISRLG
ncbi:MAG: flagellar filament capping protein FliD [Burkholderiales bacterium]|nr:flagellar filament capping protein FliD [Burkholderiales bacterium]